MTDATHGRLTRPVRTIAAAVVMGIGGWAVARAITVIVASISLPTFSRFVLPAKFSYGTPAGWGTSVTWTLTLAVVCVLLVPLLINATWLSRRVLSVAGIARLPIAAGLFTITLASTLVFADAMQSLAVADGGSASLPVRVASLIIAAVSGGLLLATFGEGMSSGEPDRWRSETAPGAARHAFIAGALASTLIALLALVANAGLGILFRALFGFLGESAEPSPLGWARLDLGLGLAIGLLFATCAALLVAVAPAPESPDWRSSTKRIRSVAIAAVPAIALVALVVWFKGYARDRGEMDRTLAQVANLEPAPEPQLMVLPANSGPRVEVYRMEVALPGMSSDEVVGATALNADSARAYLARLGGRWTSHTVAAWELPAYVHDRLLEPDSALRARVEAAEATGSVLAIAIATNKVRNMPASAVVRDVSARLLDSAHFVGSEQATVRLQGEARTPHDRTVTGHVLLFEQIRRGARVGLYRQSSADPQTSTPSTLSLVASTQLDRDGRFVFDSLPPSFYTLGVLLPGRVGKDPARVRVTGRMHVADVTGDRLRDDMGTVTVDIH